jgi:uncharacterized MnhB-related membrane protein
MKPIKWIWNKLNGRKMALGLLALAVGYAMMMCPDVAIAEAGAVVFDSGMVTVGLGALHKVKKGG